MCPCLLASIARRGVQSRQSSASAPAAGPVSLASPVVEVAPSTLTSQGAPVSFRLRRWPQPHDLGVMAWARLSAHVLSCPICFVGAARVGFLGLG